MTVPLLLEAGDVDGIVGWHQSVELYNIARGREECRHGRLYGRRPRPAPEEEPGRLPARILAWFGHYLKGEPAEAWITEGQSYIDRQAEVKRMTEK